MPMGPLPYASDAEDEAIVVEARIDYRNVAGLRYNAAVERTIATGTFVRSQALHTVDTEAAAALDTLNTVTGGAAGEMLILMAANDARSVIVTHDPGTADAFVCPDGASISLAEDQDVLYAIHNGTNWTVIASNTLALDDVIVLTDPGHLGAIPVTAAKGICAITTVGAETRTVANPTALGQELTITLNVDGGDCEITFAPSNVLTSDGGAADNVLTMADAGDTVFLRATQFGGTTVWAQTGLAGGLVVGAWA
jgi:hypothetical protein